MVRVEAMTSQAGGKGVNISRAAVAAGLTTRRRAAGAAATTRSCASSRSPASTAAPRGRPAPIRVNLTLTEPDGTTTKLNGPGAAVDAEHLDDLARTLVGTAAGGSWTVLAGSLPPGAPAAFYADLVARLRGVSRVAVDTSEGPLAALVDRLPGAAPDLLKPNAEELASVTGTDPAQLETEPEVRREGRPHPGRPRRGRRAGHAGRPRRGPRRRRRRLVRPGSPDHGGQHGGCRRLHALRLPAGRAAWPARTRPPRPGGGLRQRRRRAPRHHHPRPRRPAPGAGRRQALD